jgi:hypothetical protein
VPLIAANRYYQEIARLEPPFCPGDIFTVPATEPPDPLAANDFRVSNHSDHPLRINEEYPPDILRREADQGTPVRWPDIQHDDVNGIVFDDMSPPRHQLGPPYVDAAGCILHSWVANTYDGREVARLDPGSVCLDEEPYLWVITQDMIDAAPPATTTPD